MNRKILVCFLFSLLFFAKVSYCQTENGNTTKLYQNALDSIENLIIRNQKGDFKRAVFTVENTYLNQSLQIDSFNHAIKQLSLLARLWSSSNHILNYTAADSQQMTLNRGIFQVIKDTIKVKTAQSTIVNFLPFEYNFADYNGKQDWRNTFVSTLLETHKGNCHSLPFLYKILADELDAKCWLALAPNHMYIKNRSVKDGWFNTELTSGDFPIDAWLTTTGYISLKSIQNGLYCDALNNQQSIALCVIDLAKCYEKQTHNYYDGFIIRCCDLMLKYHAVNVQALLLKAETLKRIYEKQVQDADKKAPDTYSQMEQLYLHLYDLGYREMPDQMYREWLLSLKDQKNKYSNQKLSTTKP